MVSYAALNKLESGKEPEARLFLAGQVANYYRQLKSAQQLSPEQKKILDTIESGMAKSETLRQKLQEGSSRFPENLGCEQERQVLIARLVILIVARLAFHARRLDSSARQPRLNASR